MPTPIPSPAAPAPRVEFIHRIEVGADTTWCGLRLGNPVRAPGTGLDLVGAAHARLKWSTGRFTCPTCHAANVHHAPRVARRVGSTARVAAARAVLAAIGGAVLAALALLALAGLQDLALAGEPSGVGSAEPARAGGSLVAQALVAVYALAHARQRLALYSGPADVRAVKSARDLAVSRLAEVAFVGTPRILPDRLEWWGRQLVAGAEDKGEDVQLALELGACLAPPASRRLQRVLGLHPTCAERCRCVAMVAAAAEVGDEGDRPPAATRGLARPAKAFDLRTGWLAVEGSVAS
jgi:hypothetical protein